MTVCAQFWARSVLFCVGFVSVKWRVIDDGGPYYASNIPRTLSRKCVPRPAVHCLFNVTCPEHGVSGE